MNKKLLIIPAAVVWIALPALGAHILFGQSPVAHQIRANGTVHAQYASTSQGSLGNAREEAVIAATERYVAAHPDAPAAIREGKELAPTEALNADLAAHQARFRVRSVKGMKAQFFDVS
ncbi:MAG: hypothetical protein KDE32_04110 [Novosphingobium sp.]|nr:hypothetical protein [Novosphingobium sp.]